eukprot:PITA_22601
MPGIDPSIVVQKIPTYPGAKPVCQRLRPVHPRKAVAIKAEVEKLLKAGFMYPIPLTEWISNIVPVDKKQGTIRVCVDYRDINRACPKDNYPTPFIDQLIDECAGSEIYSFMDGFSGYNQINIAPADQHKMTFICPWGTFAYKKLPFGLKNAGATFQRAMSYAFHNIRHIVQPYLDDLPAHSAKRADHPSHLREIFLRCRHYNIHLNPHKCGKTNFLRRFIPNYAEVAKGFTWLLKRDTPFRWDAIAEESFSHLKTLVVSAPLLQPPNYHRDYTLYLAAADTTIGMVLVQDDDDGIEHVIYYLIHNLLDTETRYAYVEKLALTAVWAVQRFRHYILLCTTTVISNCNPMTYILSRQSLGGKYSKWVVILPEFDLEFTAAKSKKSLVFAELLCSLPSAATSSQIEESILDETLFLISTLDPWYGDIIFYFQMSSFRPETSKDARRRIRHQAQPYRIIGDTLYRLGVDSILCQCLTFEEAERVLNDCHSGACGGHMSGYTTTQKILCAGYFWPSIFKDCILVVRSCHECQIYQRKMRAPAAPLHPIVTVRPFAKWGIDYVTCNPRSARGHGYIIVAVDYFTKWAEAMPTLSEDGHTVAQFLFNHVISRFGVPQAIITDHGKHFRNRMMVELTTQLGLRHDSSSPYYPQANGQVEDVNKVLVTMLQRTVGMHKSNWHLMLFSTLWACWTSVKDATGFTPFQLVYGLEATLPIECEIPSLKLAVELLPETTPAEERLLYLERLDETRRLASLAIKAQNKRVKTHFDNSVNPRSFTEGDLVLLYDQASDKLGVGKLEPMWHGPYIVKRVLQKGAYELIDYEGNPLDRPRNGLYLKKYYA